MRGGAQSPGRGELRRDSSWGWRFAGRADFGWAVAGWAVAGAASFACGVASGAVVDWGAVESHGLPETRPEASAGVTIGSAGVAVPAGASASVNETAAGRGVGGGILLDWNNRTGPGAEATSDGSGAGVTWAAGGSGADVTWAADGSGADVTWAAGVSSVRLLPQAWQLVCPRKTSCAPQNWQVGFSAPDPSVTLNP